MDTCLCLLGHDQRREVMTECVTITAKARSAGERKGERVGGRKRWVREKKDEGINEGIFYKTFNQYKIQVADTGPSFIPKY